MKNTIREKLITAGIRNLKEFGYPTVDSTNILTDFIYKAFFRSMLEDNRGQGFDKEINGLIAEIDAAP